MAAIYRDLDTASREIRLLKVLPAEYLDHAIVGELKYVPLENAGPYEALSYTWGTPNFTRPIQLNSKPFYITKNLEAALRYLRFGDIERVLWVDAICINQDDLRERSSQVMLMRDIYVHSRRDIAWLGPNPPDSDEVHGADDQNEGGDGEGDGDADDNSGGREGKDHEEEDEEDEEEALTWEHTVGGLELMEQLSKKDISTLDTMRNEWTAKFGNVDEDSQPSPEDVGKIVPHPIDEGRWLISPLQDYQLNKVFGQPSLWSRIWVMQELSCAPCVTLVFGNCRLDWAHISSFLGDATYADAFHLPWAHGKVKGALRRIFQQVQLIEHQRRAFRDETQRPQSALVDVLARFKGARSTDPRDKVYGLLGLASSDHGVKVDYNRSVQQVFTDVTASIINSSRNLDIICQSIWYTDDSEQRLAGLPSWVADFSLEQHNWVLKEGFSTLLFAQRGVFSAGHATCDTPVQVEGGNTLRVRGTVIDRIGPILQGEDNTRGQYNQGLRNARAWMRTYSIDPAANGTDFTAFWRTLTFDCKAYPTERLTEDDIVHDDPAYTELLTGTSEDPPGFHLQDQFVSAEMFDRAAAWWRFSKSETGLYLMLRPNVREGDLLSVLDGGKVPMVLRPARSTSDAKYEFVSSAYVHGYMDGQAELDVLASKREKLDMLIS